MYKDDRIYEVGKILSEYSIYRYKIIYISKKSDRINYYDMFAKYASTTFCFISSTYDILKNNSILEICENIVSQYKSTESNYIAEVTNLLIDTIYEDVTSILLVDNDIDKIYKYFYSMSSYGSLVYESLYIKDGTVLLGEDIRNPAILRNVENSLVTFLSKNNKLVNVNIINGNTTLDKSNLTNVVINNITLKEYNSLLSEIHGVNL